jgi:hypothetical protein
MLPAADDPVVSKAAATAIVPTSIVARRTHLMFRQR